MPLSQASYRHRPISTIDALGRALGYSAPQLRAIAKNADKLYRVKIISKEGKKDRVTHPATGDLKRVQSQITRLIFRNVRYPEYLMGGIPDPEHVRGYIRSAEAHVGSAIVIGEDVSNFFPSVPVDHVRAIFQHVLYFPREVALVLATLCCRKGFLVQGASPSTYIANLVFFQHEPRVFEYLRECGLEYKRFIDDVNVSSLTKLSPAQLQSVVSLLRRLIERVGLKTNRKKQLIASRGQRRTVHNLNIDGAKATLPSSERKKIRAHVFSLERTLQKNEVNEETELDYSRAYGRVLRLEKLHPNEGRQLKDRLALVRKALPKALQTSRKSKAKRA